MHATLERLKASFAAELEGLDAGQTQQRPLGRPEAWTVQQIVEHLLLTYARTVETMKARLERGSATKATATASNRLVQFAVARLGYFPAGRQAPEMVQPRASAVPTAGQDLCQELARSLAAMDEQLSAVERGLGHGRVVSHAILGPMSVANWRRFHLAHARHHLKQVRRIVGRAAPPEAAKGSVGEG